MFSRFFIDRPIFAAVVSIVITLAGLLALTALPVAQYPEISPPAVTVSISYPGASARVVADTVAAPIEQQVNGIPGVLYLSSNSGNDGSYSLTVTFDIGTPLNTALVQVQNRVQLALPVLPTAVQLQGITVRKRTPDILQVVNLVCPDGRYDNLYLSNFATITLRDEVLRVEGVSDISVFGQRDYSMRVWLDPPTMAAANITTLDVAAAIRAQNVAAAPGAIGSLPGGKTRAFQFPLDTSGRLVKAEEFGAIVIKAGPPGGPPALAATAAAGGAKGGADAVADPLAAGASKAAEPGGTDPGSPASPSGGSAGSTGTSSGSTGSGGGMSPTTGGAASTGGATSAGVTTKTDAAGVPTDDASGMNAAPPALAAPDISRAGGAAGSDIPATGGTVGPFALTGGSLDGGPNPSAGIVRLKDVARVELGASSYTTGATFDGMPSVGLAIRLQPGANALDVADRVRAKMAELRPRFPDGVGYEIAYDTTPFIRESITDVIKTLFEAVGLVAVVVLVFLQNWRAALIPLIAVPVAVLGTFAVMLALGFTVNNISLFGLVLAIGIVVDDAIVVVENVERWLEQGLAPTEAAYKAMGEVTGPVVAIALVLCAVFVPCAFVGGISGQFYRQFAVTITASTVLSAINSLTLSPALAALLMRKKEHARDPVTRVLDFALGWFFRLFNRVFELGTAAYAWAVGRLLRLALVVLVLYAGLLFVTVRVFQKAPLGFVPEQDQGRLIVSIQLPDSASLERTGEVMQQVDEIGRRDPAVAHTTSTAGTSLLAGANSSNFGSVFLILKPFAERQSPELKADAVLARLWREYAKIRDADIKAFGSAPVPGLSVAGGFKVVIEDRGGADLAALQKQADRFVAALAKEPPLVGVLTQFRSKTPQLYLDVDRTKVQALGVNLNDVNQTMQMQLGSLYVTSYNEFGRHWQVTVQAEGRYRTKTESVGLLQVRNKTGEMVPLSTLVRLKDVNGPVSVNRYNLYTAAAVSGNVRPEASSGEAIAAVDRVAAEVLPRSMTVEWTELFYLQIRTGNTAIYVFLLAVVFVFLALAALYESWLLPLAVILVVPLCLLCSVGGVRLAGKSVDIFVQIGLVVLVGLACKNAILIVEFAEVLHRGGKSRHEAAVEASRLRIRPILMTSLAFVLGVVPLVVASGAGAEMRRSLGIAVFSGMIGVTAFGVFLTPVFFDLTARAGDTRWLSRGTVRWTATVVIGGLTGATAALLIARLTDGDPVPSAALGGAVGAAGAVAGQLLRRVRRRKRPTVEGRA